MPAKGRASPGRNVFNIPSMRRWIAYSEDEEKEAKKEAKKLKKKTTKDVKAEKKSRKRLSKRANVSPKYRKMMTSAKSTNLEKLKNIAYSQAVLKDQPKYVSKKPKVQTRAAIKREKALGTAGRTLSKMGRAAANPYLFAAMTVLDPTPANVGEDEAVRARNKAWSAGPYGGKRYAHGGGVRKTRLTDY